jgi:5-methylcytosine-specific restriction endonuclease McrA
MKCCKLHSSGKYKHWPCGEYKPEIRRSIYLSKSKKCIDCGKDISYLSNRCRKCSAIKTSINRIGKKLPESWIENIRENHTKGENHHWWKGGISPENKKIRRSKEFREWRKSVFMRDKWTCVWCGQVGGELHPDHIKPFSLFPELRFELSNGRTLCVPCHRKTDTWGHGANNITREQFELKHS